MGQLNDCEEELNVKFPHNFEIEETRKFFDDLCVKHPRPISKLLDK